MRTPPTPPPPGSPVPARVRAVAQLRPVSIPDIVRDVAQLLQRQTLDPSLSIVHLFRRWNPTMILRMVIISIMTIIRIMSIIAIILII